MLSLPPGPTPPPAAVISLPHPRPCHAALCTVPSVAHVIWLAGPTLSVREVCAGHMTLFRELPQPCAFAPLDSLPPIHVLARAVQDEHQRRVQQQAAQRIRQQQGQPMYMQFTTAGFTTTSTTWNMHL